MNFVFKSNEGYFIFWLGTLVFWERYVITPGLAWIASFCSCFYSKKWDTSWDQYFISLFVMLINGGMGEWGIWSEILRNLFEGLKTWEAGNYKSLWWIDWEWLWLKLWKLCKSWSAREHLDIQFLWATAWLLVALVSLIFLVEELVLVRLSWSARQEMLGLSLWYFKVKNWTAMGTELTSFFENWFLHARNR